MEPTTNPSATARLNLAQDIATNRAQHVADFAQYLTGRPLEALRELESDIFGGLADHYWTHPEDIATQRAKLAAVQSEIDGRVRSATLATGQ